MAGFLNSLKNQYRSQVDRHHNVQFLRATMAACALVATADGRVSFTETVRVDQIASTLKQLKSFDPHEATDLFRDYCDTILESPKEGHTKILSELDRVKENPETAELLIRICLAVAESNGETSLVDQIEIVTLCSLMEIDPIHFGLYRNDLVSRAESR